MTLGNIIKQYREEHQLSMDAFSELSGISKAYISLLEKNKHPKTGKEIAPSIQCIRQAATGMNMDFNVLFDMLDGSVNVQDVKIPELPKINTLAAHFEGEDFTEDEMAEIMQFAAFVKSKRK